ncbi:MAG: hypothetical protein JFAIHJKO_02856 [Pyrinomonadaceae bacterium]|nr:hypothetical protein [Pyrinomonadaceae bacterium]
MESLSEHKGCELFTAYATSAEHRDAFVILRREFVCDVLRQVAELFDLRIHGAGKRSGLEFVRISRIENKSFRVADEFVPVGR